MMVEQNQDSFRTAYTVSVDARLNVTTGISALDRSHTINLLSTSTAPSDFNRPGHVFPLRAVEGGVLVRQGHTEAAVDLCRLTGKNQVAAISEIVMDDGLMARRGDLLEFSNRFGIKIITISDLVIYRNTHKV